MKTRKLLSIMTVALMSLSVIPTTAITTYAAETTTINQTAGSANFYKSQLNAQEQTIYNALDTMNKTGLFLSGKGSLDLLKNGITQQQANAYVNGDKTLAQSFQSARDAYMADHPALFYVDFTKVTLRANKNGTTLELGTGNNANYYVAGFSTTSQITNAVASYNKNLTAMLTIAKKQAKGVNQIRNIHTQIINKANYTGSGNYVTSGYGVFNGKANCQGYSNLFKDAMDNLGYENMVVIGSAVNSKGQTESHMWNYVKLDDQWFAVDATWDDPIGGRMKDTYFMRGSNVMDETHLASNVFSPNSKKFVLPELSNIGYEEESTVQEYNPEGFFVETQKGVDSDNDAFTVFNVSYKGQGAAKLEAGGQVMAMRYSPDGVNFNEWTPVVLYSRDSQDGSYTSFSISKAGSIQFAMTTLPFPRAPKYTQDLSEAQYNVGLSEKFDIQYIDNYVPGPQLRAAKPAVSGIIRPVEQNISVQFDEAMEIIDPNAPVTIEVGTTEDLLVYEVKNINWNTGKATLYDGQVIDVTNLSFTFNPDKTYQGSANVYSFQVKNLRGVKTGKEAKAFEYRTSEQTACVETVTDVLYSVVNMNKLSDEAINASNYTPSKHDKSTNVVLVATKNDGSTASYDLTFNCSPLLQYMTRGREVKLGVPFPKGFDARTENVTYAASHYVRYCGGGYIGQQMNVKITEKGLELTMTIL